MSTQQDLSGVQAMVENIRGEPPHQLSVSRRRIRGGLEAAWVEHVAARFRDARGARQTLTFVRKRLRGNAMREAHVYEQVVAHHAAPIAPRLLGVTRRDPEEVELYLEAVRAARVWPWREVQLVGRVLERVAALHEAPARALWALPAWDNERELARSAVATLEALSRCRADPDLRALSAGAAPAKRLALAIAQVRAQLLAARFGAAALHGDLHPGNVVVRQRRSREPVLLDWGRARGGSPLEDVSSWLQSLGYWEPEARRRHDTLLARYLSVRGWSAVLTSDVRDAYWLAGASNALAGALEYHLRSALDAATAASKARAAGAALMWLRVLRRADAAWS